MRDFRYRFEIALDRARDDEANAKRWLAQAMTRERDLGEHLAALRADVARRVAESRPASGSSASWFAEGERRVERAEAQAAEVLCGLEDARRAAESARAAADLARRRRETFERHRARALERRALELEIQAAIELDETNRGRERKTASEEF